MTPSPLHNKIKKRFLKDILYQEGRHVFVFEKGCRESDLKDAVAFLISEVPDKEEVIKKAFPDIFKKELVSYYGYFK